LISPALEQLNRLAHAGVMGGVARWAGNSVEVDARSRSLANAPCAMATDQELQAVLAFIERCPETDHGGSFVLTCPAKHGNAPLVRG
jgi:hypothetical protein